MYYFPKTCFFKLLVKFPCIENSEMEIGTTHGSLELLHFPALVDALFVRYEDYGDMNVWWEATVEYIKAVENIVTILATGRLMFVVAHGYAQTGCVVVFSECKMLRLEIHEDGVVDVAR